MAHYVDGFVLPVPQKNLDAYRQMAEPAGKIWMANENTWGGGGDPAAGTGEAFSGISGTFFPAASMLNINVYECHGRFSLSSLTYAPPSGFLPWQT